MDRESTLYTVEPLNHGHTTTIKYGEASSYWVGYTGYTVPTTEYHMAPEFYHKIEECILFTMCELTMLVVTWKSIIRGSTN